MGRGTRMLGLMLASAALASASASGQATRGGRTGEGTAEAAPQEGAAQPGNADGARRGPWDDPAARLRMLRMQVSNRQPNFGGGGRGGPGGGGRGGPGGGGIIGLLMQNEALQEELKLTEEQERELTTITRESRDKMRDMFRDRDQGQGRGGQNNQRGQRGGFNAGQFEQMQMQMAAMREENEAAVGRVLSREQMKRLNQIRLRILGPLGVAEEDIATAIGLLPVSPDRYEQVLAIVAEMDQQNGELMRQNFQNMRGGRGGPGGFGGGPGGGGPGGPGGFAGGPGGGGPGGAGQAGGRGRDQAQNAAGGNRQGGARGQQQGGQQGRQAGGDDDDDDARADRAQAARERMTAFMNSDEGRAMQARMAEMSKKQDEITKQAEIAIGKVLTSAEKKKFNSFMGPDFDLMKLAQARPGGDRGRRGGESEANNRPAPRAATPAPAETPAAGTADEPGEAAPAPAARPQPRVRGAGSRTRTGS